YAGKEAVHMLQSRVQSHVAAHRRVDPDVALCEELRTATWPTGRVLCGGEILTYGWDVYNEQCAKLTPRFIMQPKTTEDVQKAVRFAKNNNLNISFRGQGHTYNCAAFQQNSLNLDLRTMGSTVTTRKIGEDTLAILSPGSTFQTIKDTISSQLSFTHGTCPTVGVMGFHLHGGWGATTDTWANESIVQMEVVTADGALHTLNAESTGEEAQLWNAMRVAGSSFGIVTELTIRLFNRRERPYLVLPVLNDFDFLLSKVPNGAAFGWVGLARWDKVFYPQSTVLGHGWILQIVLNDLYPWTLTSALSWVFFNGIQLAFSYFAQIPPNIPTNAETWLNGLYPFQDSAVFTRFYPLSDIRDKAKLLESFLSQHVDNCRYNLGPLQGESARLPLVTVECNTLQTAALLKDFVRQNSAVLLPDKPGSGYINLPLDDTSTYREAYFPQYDELAAIKCLWDPSDLFYSRVGIHPEGCSGS
ncbi:xylO, partial [Symbiodinium pilosum]